MRFPDGTDANTSCYRACRETDKRPPSWIGRRWREAWRGAQPWTRLLLATATLTCAPRTGAQPLPEVEVDVISPRVYAMAVDAYAAGDHGAGIARLARVVPSAVLAATRTAIPALAADAGTRPAGVVASATPDVAVRRWRAAAVLHLDTAYRLAQRYRADAVAPHLAALDLILARLQAADTSEDADAFRRDCRLARLHHLIVAGDPETFDRLAELHRERGVPDVALAFVRGVSHETRARALPPRPIDRRPSRARAPLAAATTAGMRRVWHTSHFRQAVEAYQAVLAEAPHHAEARVRLARVRLEQGDPAAALEVLAPLTTACTEAEMALGRLSADREAVATTCALAWLTSGEAQDARADVEAAHSAYLRAAAVPGVRPAALVAMRALPRSPAEMPDMGASPAAAGPAAADEQAPRPGPPAWRNYLLGVTHEQARLMMALREAVR